MLLAVYRILVWAPSSNLQDWPAAPLAFLIQLIVGKRRQKIHLGLGERGNLIDADIIIV